MSTSTEWGEPSAEDEREKPGHLPSPLSESAASLADVLAAEKDLRREERFFWIFGVAILLDIIVFDNLTSWPGCVAIFILQLIFLIGIAQWLGIDWVVVWLERVLGKYLTTDKDK